ncbi:MAG: D-glycero-beta-D-manno-heptose 1,7-bisphosphate 7-phosphatase [Burkholderiaceae bacterium]|jgi:D-glycero-D-manno-heptose 1,7-bisphosphate phosphatase|nr:D-glycero-beta-D-manno-heptose 1,7-bisphosphate 7-phosphatase [Burkholderiaceae bacterium]MDP3134295.1 D-glycero-beta-D-manno-heptose 1,7-bisphosphate 7-phosphatase [Burkholderiaceae bacterium]MDP3423960.1 D-glycero-beta-D-manno-heptose 1,7-bisphosphate 7-phosphatase [Burkholderiaceae bacterium]MDZ4162783.1 D-glycero-beta-D-manno-heptose 1,7-bisphosphate 7-phosphatase [Burkholderiales bacterium]
MKLLILDRDGTLNRARSDFITSPEEWEPLPGALEAVARLNQAGWRVVIASNQPAIGRGLLDLVVLNAIHTKMHKALAAVGGRVEAVFFCPHVPDDACTCRKPAPGLYLQIAERYGVSLKDMPAAGDSVWDAQAAAAAGCQPHLLLTGNSWVHRDGSLPEGLPVGTQVHTDLQAFADSLVH